MASLPLVPQQHPNPPENHLNLQLLQHQQNAHRDQGAAAAVRPAVAGVRPETDSDKVLLLFSQDCRLTLFVLVIALVLCASISLSSCLLHDRNVRRRYRR